VRDFSCLQVPALPGVAQATQRRCLSVCVSSDELR
jgi:hypothetical protein